MADMIPTSTHPESKKLIDMLSDLQGADGIVLSVQINPRGLILVGMHGQFGSLEEFRKYLQRNNLPFESLEYDNQKYIMRKGPIMAEFYKFD